MFLDRSHRKATTVGKRFLFPVLEAAEAAEQVPLEEWAKQTTALIPAVWECTPIFLGRFLIIQAVAEPAVIMGHFLLRYVPAVAARGVLLMLEMLKPVLQTLAVVVGVNGLAEVWLEHLEVLALWL